MPEPKYNTGEIVKIFDRDVVGIISEVNPESQETYIAYGGPVYEIKIPGDPDPWYRYEHDVIHQGFQTKNVWKGLIDA